MIDLVLIREIADFSAGDLRRALATTFGQRGHQESPSLLPAPPTAWSAPYRGLATEVGLDPDLGVGFRQAAAFINPILDGAVSDEARWENEALHWV